MAIGSILVVVWAPAPIGEHLLRKQVIDEARLWAERIVHKLEHGHEAFRAGRITEADVEQLAQIPTTSDVFAAALFAPDGLVLWSSDPAEIGTLGNNVVLSELATARQPVYFRESVSATEIPFLHLHAVDPAIGTTREIAEAYVPVLSDGAVTGAIEVYTDVTDEKAFFVRRIQLFLAALMAAGSLLVLLPLGLSHRYSILRMRQMEATSRNKQASLTEQLRLAREVKLLGELNEWLQLSRSLDELFDMVSRFMESMLPNSRGSFYIYSNSRDVLDGAAAWGGGRPHAHIRPHDCWALRRGRAYRFGAGEVDFSCEHVTENVAERAYYCFPILAHGETIGLMHMGAGDDADMAAFSASFELARMCAEQVALAVANVRLRDELREQSLRDPLTGLYNRRFLTETLRTGLQSTCGKDRTLALLSLDVDHFKAFNDRHGHDAGDVVLRAVGTILMDSCTLDDVACRTGGEEFMLVWPGATVEDAQERAERLRAGVEQLRIQYSGAMLPNVSISIGVAAAPAHGSVPQELMRAADEALYAAKHAGRNRICTAGSLETAGVLAPKRAPELRRHAA